MQDFSTVLLSLMTAETVEQAASSALQALVSLLQPQAACVLIWDSELGRYTVGDTWLRADQPPGSAADVRRLALQHGKRSRALDPGQHRSIEPDIFYQPLGYQSQHVGAYVCMGLERLPEADD